MTIKNQNRDERRNHPRHQNNDSSAVMLLPDSIISFCILDISQNGLAFCYNGTGLDSKLADNAFVAFYGENGGAANIPVKIISDIEFAKEDIKPDFKDDSAEIPYLRRCAVKFDSPSRDQELAITDYIQGLKSN
jgi:hypothetical protein